MNTLIHKIYKVKFQTKCFSKVTVILFYLIICIGCKPNSVENPSVNPSPVKIFKNDTLDRVDIYIGEKYFSSYLYTDNRLRKPVLFPLISANGTRVTRGFPFDPQPGERADHVHHYGLWFNHGNVNGVDYWNSAVKPRKPNVRYGSINHVRFLKMESGKVGVLKVQKEWRDDKGNHVLDELTTYTFSGTDNSRTITHTSTLKAVEVDVTFTDTKEGMLAIRVRRELEVASKKATTYLDDQLNISDTKLIDSTNVTGHYSNSNRLQGYPQVWGKRAKWMRLEGKVKNNSISICIFDHPENINHPPHWMARDYGLFGVNALGSNSFTQGKETLNHRLEKGSTLTFINEIEILSDDTFDHQDIEKRYAQFVNKHKTN